MHIAVQSLTRQHSEYDEDSGRSSAWRISRNETANTENSCGKTQHLGSRRRAERVTEPMILRRAQHRSWFPGRSFGKCTPCLGMQALFVKCWLRLLRCHQSELQQVSTTPIGSRLIACARNKQSYTRGCIEYSFVYYGKVVQLKPDQLDRWLPAV